MANAIFPIVCIVLISAPAAAAQQIWLSGVDPVVQADRGGGAESDFITGSLVDTRPRTDQATLVLCIKAVPDIAST